MTTISKIKTFISSSATSLRSALSAFTSTATVEAEFGAECVEGSVLTLAHHGERSARPCPCSLPNFPEMGIEAVGISHVDLDTLGGLMAVSGIKTTQYQWVKEFWKVASMVDIWGPHRLQEILETVYHKELVTDALNAFWAFSESPEGRVFAPRDGSTVEVDLSRHFEVLNTLLEMSVRYCTGGIDEHEHNVYCGCKQDVVGVNVDGEDIIGEFTWNSQARLDLLEKGREWAAAKAELEASSFVAVSGSVILRQAVSFVNHLYNHEGVVFKAVVGFNNTHHSVTVSLAEAIPGFSVAEFVQELWGSAAGGHATIGGSPRGQEMTTAQAAEAALKLAEALSVLK